MTMTESLAIRDEHEMQRLYQAVTANLKQGKSEEKNVNWLILKGWNENDAEAFVDKIALEISLEQERSKQSATKTPMSAPESAVEKVADYSYEPDYGRSSGRMWKGLLWAGGGAIATLLSYNSAAGGGAYTVFYGAIIYGVYEFFSGLTD